MDQAQIKKARRGRSSQLFLGLLLLALPTAMACGGAQEGETVDPFASQAPAADFDQDVINGQPGLQVQFRSTAIGDIDTHQWDFDGGIGDASSPDPLVTFDEPGTYTIGLTVSGPLGSGSVEREALIRVGEAVVPGFNCPGDTDPAQPICPNSIGFAPFPLSFQDQSENADSWVWDFGDGTTSTEQSPSHTYTQAGVYSVVQTASGPGGTAVSAPLEVQVAEFNVTSDVQSGAAAPQTVTFTADAGVLSGTTFWSVFRDGQPDGSFQLGGNVFTTEFRRTGSYVVEVTFASPAGSDAFYFAGPEEIQFEVGCGESVAAFESSVAGGMGPLDVTFNDLSVGQVESWAWDFGDGNRCVYPDLSGGDPDYTGDPVCLNRAEDLSSEGTPSPNPTHTYESMGSFDVGLQVTGAACSGGAGSVSDSPTQEVRIYMLDPSFEQQVAEGPDGVGTPWVHRPQFFPIQGDLPTHTVASGSDVGMPTDGDQWAVLDGIGTDGSVAVEEVDNSISQNFILPREKTVLALDLALAFDEPPGSGSQDRVTAHVSDGLTTVPIDGARIDTTAAYAGQSTRYPDGSESNPLDVWVTPPRAATLDVAEAFGVSTPTPPPDEGGAVYTLTIRVGNADDRFRSPRAYVDNVRFMEPAAPGALLADFTCPALVVAGESVEFTNTTDIEPCPQGPEADCLAATSWTWNFGTGALANLPASAASSQQSPVYIFDEPGERTVTLTARYANLESSVSETFTVVPGVEARFSVSPSGPWTVDQALTFQDLSTSDPSDPIVSWEWDIPASNPETGKGSFDQPDPDPVSFASSSDYLVTLTVQTQSGRVESYTEVISID